MDEVHEHYGLKKRYRPSVTDQNLTSETCPATRMANGTTHYLLYRWCVDSGEPLCILEHDAEIVGELPEHKPDGVIQVSSHCERQLLNPQDWLGCRRGQRMRLYEPYRQIAWTDDEGVVPHPLNGTNGTSGYVIAPGAARKMIDYIHDSGIAFADRIRTARIGEGNLWLQKPQSVMAHHSQARSHRLAQRLSSISKGTNIRSA